MKPTLPLTLLICAALSEAGLRAATKYWDIDGATPGAGGATPAGTWDTGATANWTTSSTGSAAGTSWASGDDAVFSAGTDATGAFAVTLDAAASPPVQNAGNLTVEEGNVTIVGNVGLYLNVGGGAPGKGIINVAGGAAATIAAPLDDTYGGLGDDTGVLTKTGTGTLTLSSNSFFGATVVVTAGALALNDSIVLGSTLAPTIVSNGASVTLPLTGYGGSFGEPVVLNGFGVGGNGALYGNVGSGGNTPGGTWNGGAVINSNARINKYGTNGAWWNWLGQVVVTNGVNSADLYLGGTGNALRFNINAPYPSDSSLRRPCIDIGDGVLYKDGTVEWRVENSNVAREVRFNGGHITSRCGPGTNFCYRVVVPGVFTCLYLGMEGAFWTSGDYVPATIYVGPNAGEFRNGPTGPSQEWDHPIVLETGANPVFRPNSYAEAYIICNGVISGAGGLSKNNDTGTLYLRGTNTYAGTTTVRGGFLTLDVTGSISNSTVIDVWTNGTFNVSSNGSGFVLGLAQTLKGNGTVLGNVTAVGAIAPGSSIGSLTNSGNLVLKGNLSIEVDKSLSPGASNDLITVTGSLSHGSGATVTVANLGPALAVNDSFKIFNKAVTSGSTISVTGGGATWTNRLAIDGSIAVLALAPTAVPATNLTVQAVGATSRSLGGMGAANSAYSVYASTNVATPMSNWWKLGTTNSSAGGVIQYLDAQATNSQRFYRFGQP